MSMMLMVKAMQIKVGNPLRKLVLLKLADNASDTGECWPSHQNIADQCEISKRSVINHIDALVEMGLLRVENRIKNNEKQSNIYYLTLDGHPLAEEPKKGSAGDSLPSAGAAHRTSHSFEPISSGSSNNLPENAHQQIIDKWNASGFVQIKAIVSGSQREKLLKARIKEFSLEQVLEAIDIANQSEFLKGGGSKGWVMDFTWFLRPNNFIKVYEGKYANRLSATQGDNHATYPNYPARKLSAVERVRIANERARAQRAAQNSGTRTNLGVYEPNVR
ncbi:helix-turn-helix domain-containing protein [Wohlfahrtiimonas chitiniclastica]|uniref:helix-turn-helix domain-containing protein n=1 Tax=Wohlfahrtiimonas chitiniclastica TaxID=400946 RepID=UPI001BCFBBD9|nr:helix-turn-helix domain-containing protein [Wohlfahrtiimonas chitiniclastica]MBS7818999.1 helix-turn-helix domain-containing protein [Wohlfahrtiimonas chitiniclastica]